MTKWLQTHLKKQGSFYITCLCVVTLSLFMNAKNTISMLTVLITDQHTSIQTRLQDQNSLVNQVINTHPTLASDHDLYTLSDQLNSNNSIDIFKLTPLWINTLSEITPGNALNFDNHMFFQRAHQALLFSVAQYNANVTYFNHLLTQSHIKIAFYNALPETLPTINIDQTYLQQFEVVN